MTSYRFHWRPSGRGDTAKGSLFIRVIHNRRYKDIVRPYDVNRNEWFPNTRTVKIPPAGSARHSFLQEVSLSMTDDLKRLERVINDLHERGTGFTVPDICRALSGDTRQATLYGYATTLSKGLNSTGRHRTGRAYLSAVQSLMRFTGRDLALTDICQPLIRSYEQWLLERGLQMNTVSFYMRNLRAVYYRAVKAGLIHRGEINPFEDVFTGVFETRRRALDRQELGALADLDLTNERHLTDARNYFMFAFHARGMSFVDLAHLKKSDIKGDTILYKRRKTGFFIELKITRPMQRIINHYKKQTRQSHYVFPIIGPLTGKTAKQYETGLSTQNLRLKELASIAGIGKALSTHVARHTWATLAKRMGYSIALISEGLGHRDTKVTSIYLASFERSAMDELSTRLSRCVRAA